MLPNLFKKRPIRAKSTNKDLVDRRRVQIIRRTSKVFRNKGINGISMEEVAKMARTSIGSLYRYFGSKEDILYAIFEDGVAKYHGYVLNRLPEIEGMNPKDALRELIRAHLYWTDSVRDQAMILYLDARSMSKNDLKAMQAGDADIVRIFERVLERGIKDGEFRIDDQKLMAHNIKALLDMWAVRGWALRQFKTLDQYLEGQYEFILRAISTR